ncbi:cytochrome P450 [Thermothelomyces heterothallicus CBS 202.75]|uniref:cytochrome P450 n=1 Tax=Thermothelomyces heterothallicus CBS 202.75 TaxID=1149848 RepID=UPI0037446E54
MTVASHLFGFPSLTLAAAVEFLVAIRLFPDLVGSHGRLTLAAGAILVNYAFGLVFWAFLYPNFFSPLRRIRGPRAIVSAAYQSMIVKEGPSGNLFLDLVGRYPDEELIALDCFGRQILVAKPHLLADLLVHKCYDFAKPRRISAFLRRVLGNGLVTVEEDQHKFIRKNTMPAFRARHITDLYPMMWSKAGVLVRTLNRQIASASSAESKGSAVLELTSWAHKVTLDIIGVAGMGRALNVVEKPGDPLQELYEELLEPDREKIIFAALSLAFGFPVIRMFPWRMNNLFIYLTSSLENICRDLIKEKRKAIVENKDDHFDILSLLIKTGNFDDEVLKDQLLTFLAAGHETTASALAWSSYLLAKHQEYQKKLRDEVTEALGEKPVAGELPVDLAGVLKQLPYLNGIMHETLRLYPTVPLTMREALRDTRLGDQPIPKGTEVVVSIWQVNRSPEIWGPDADRFRPERWINADDGKANRHGGARSNYDFLTFLQGPRSCIGQEFAKAEMRCLLAALVTSFSWDLAMDESKIVPRGVITIKPEHGMYLRMRPLHHGAA